MIVKPSACRRGRILETLSELKSTDNIVHRNSRAGPGARTLVGDHFVLKLFRAKCKLLREASRQRDLDGFCPKWTIV